MAFTLLASTSEASADTHGITSPSFDSTGCDLIVVITTQYNASTAVSDNQSNSYTQLTEARSATDALRTRIHYIIDPVTSATHTVSFGGSGSYASMVVFGFSAGGTPTYDDDTENGGYDSRQAGPITPGGDGALFIAGLGHNTAPSGNTINQSFSDPIDEDTTGTNYGTHGSYLIQGTAAEIDPTWTFTPDAHATPVLASFLPPAGGGGNVIDPLSQNIPGIPVVDPTGN